MRIGKDLKRARRRGVPASRVRVEVIKDGSGTVREVRAAPLAKPPTAGGGIAGIPFANAAEAPDAVVIRRWRQGVWYPVTAAKFASDVASAAKGLVAAGLGPQGRVALMARTSYEWTVLDFAIWAAGGQSVPIYPTSSAEQIEWILRDSDARFLIIETPGNADTAARAVKYLRDPPRIWQITAGGLADLAELGRRVPDTEIEQRIARLRPDSVATICYTSGTTGNPKGCALTHGNLHAEAANTIDLMYPVFTAATGQQASTLLFLPLAHILGRAIQIACLRARIEIGHSASVKPDDLRPLMKSFRPTFVVGVPYLFEKIRDAGRETAERMHRGSSFDRAERVAIRYGAAHLRRYLGAGPRPRLRDYLAWKIYDLLVYRRIRAELGGQLRYALCGGSPLDRDLNLFFYAAGIVIYEGYGLTETTAAATVTPPLSPRPGTVGQPVPGTAIHLAGDGEVLVKGGIVFRAYWNNPRASDAVLRDGWLATGDLGSLDEDGYLTITGRKKDILITTGGKNVSPAVLEDRLRSRALVGQCVVVGDERPYVAALITLDPDALRHWLTVRKRPLDQSLTELRYDPHLWESVQAAVDYANDAVSQAEAIRRFLIVDGAFTEENGLLTPSLKVRRQAVLAAYSDAIEELYRRLPPGPPAAMRRLIPGCGLRLLVRTRRLRGEVLAILGPPQVRPRLVGVGQHHRLEPRVRLAAHEEALHLHLGFAPHDGAITAVPVRGRTAEQGSVRGGIHHVPRCGRGTACHDAQHLAAVPAHVRAAALAHGDVGVAVPGANADHELHLIAKARVHRRLGRVPPHGMTAARHGALSPGSLQMVMQM
ncbi:MAG TPA: AMP-dependent synthetase/ligase [Streptosporangiaceae bacterium]|nr:AMP-dependent synthetase/ligase [Streptosporangiaceae bacterium]